LGKLQYVGRVAAEYGQKSPVVIGGSVDMPVEEIKVTLSEWYEAVYKNRINEEQLAQIMHRGESESPKVMAREAVLISSPS